MILLLLLACVDRDRDGWPLPDDCDDADPTVHPGADERCDGRDEDCDGVADEPEDLVVTWYRDADGDGAGDAADGRAGASCVAPAGRVAAGDDCDDQDPAVHPGATEVCNGYDDDCDGLQDDADPSTDPASFAPYYSDADHDGWGAGPPAGWACLPVASYSTSDADCDDGYRPTHPGAEERCGDDRDNDCDPDTLPCGHAGSENVEAGGAWSIVAPPEGGAFVSAAAAPGDVDGDGADDLLFLVDAAAPWAWVARGPFREGERPADLGLAVPTPELTGAGPVAWGDLDGVGEPDLLVGDPDYAVGRGRLVIAPAPLGPEPGEPWSLWGDDAGAGAVVLLADVHGDAALDVVTTGGPGGAAMVVPGPVGAGGELVELAVAALAADGGRVEALAAGDIDGDGRPELALGAPDGTAAGPGVGAVHLHAGGDLAAGRVLLAETAGTAYGIALAFGDHDGDGYADLAVGEPERGSGGRVEVWDGPTLAGEGGRTGQVRPTDGGAEPRLVRFGGALAWVPDANGDGADELVVHGAPSGGAAFAVHLWYGPVAGASGVEDAEGGFRDSAGSAAPGLGLLGADLDGDGRGDLVLSVDAGWAVRHADRP